MSVRLPPAEKLPLAIRKNFRDKWDTKKPEVEEKLSAVLGTPWTVEADALAIYPYTVDTWAKDNPGNVITLYVEGAISRLEEYKEKLGADGFAAINVAAPSHVLLIDVDETGKLPYNGVTFRDGKLVLLFNAKNYGTNHRDALIIDKLMEALNSVPAAAGAGPALSFKAAVGVRNNFEPNIGAVQDGISKLLGVTVTLVPNAAASFVALKTAADAGKASLDRKWEDNFGGILYMYFESFRKQLENKDFGKDEMLREALTEAVDKNTIEFRIVDSLKAGYSEVVIDDGKLYIQTTPSKWANNLAQVGEKIVDLL